MFQNPFDCSSTFDLVAKSFAPVTRGSELSAKAFEKLARFQLETAVSYVNHAAARLQATVQSRSPLELATRHTELTAKFVEERTAEWQDFLKFSSELQSDVTKLSEDAKTQMASSLRAAA